VTEQKIIHRTDTGIARPYARRWVLNRQQHIMGFVARFGIDAPHRFAPGAETVRLRRNDEIHHNHPLEGLGHTYALPENPP
jgi:hypothetical protein